MDDVTKNMEELFALAKNAKVDYPIQNIGKMLGAASGAGLIVGASKGLTFNLSTMTIMVGSIGTVVTAALLLTTSGENEIKNPEIQENAPVITTKINPRQVIVPTVDRKEDRVIYINNEEELKPTIAFTEVVEDVALIEEETVELESSLGVGSIETSPIGIASEEKAAVQIIDLDEDPRSPGDDPTRTMEDFHSIDMRLGADVHVHNANGGKNTVKINADEEVKELIDIHVSNGVLIIAQKKGIKRKDSNKICCAKVDIVVTMNTVKKITVAGSGNIHATENLNSEELEIDVMGSGDVHFEDISPKKLDISVQGSGDVTLGGKGEVQEGKIRIQGSGDVCTGGNSVKNMSVKIFGSGDVWTVCDEELSVEISGSGDVSYSGDAKLNVSTMGSGEVNHVNDGNCWRD